MPKRGARARKNDEKESTADVIAKYISGKFCTKCKYEAAVLLNELTSLKAQNLKLTEANKAMALGEKLLSTNCTANTMANFQEQLGVAFAVKR